MTLSIVQSMIMLLQEAAFNDDTISADNSMLSLVIFIIMLLMTLLELSMRIVQQSIRITLMLQQTTAFTMMIMQQSIQITSM